MSTRIPSIPPSLLEERDGKLYYVGPIRTPVIETPNDGLTREERWALAEQAIAELKDYDFEAYDRMREFEKKLAEEELRLFRERNCNHDSD